VIGSSAQLTAVIDERYFTEVRVCSKSNTTPINSDVWPQCTRVTDRSAATYLLTYLGRCDVSSTLYTLALSDFSPNVTTICSVMARAVRLSSVCNVVAP